MGCSVRGTKLEEQMIEAAGNKLLTINPSSIEDLLKLLDRVGSLLVKVEQLPSRSMQSALLPSMKALIVSELLRHPNADVKVSVACCMNELMRITAPDAPYQDEIMKDIFQLTTAAFETLSNVSSRSYTKAVSILDTFAKIRSCAVMLDLECDALIAEMFQHFFNAARCKHPRDVFLDMETIMTTVLDESEDISWDILSPLLASLKKEDEDISSTSRKLGERVITKSGGKLKPYLLKAVESMDIVLDKYVPIVADICEKGFEHESASNLSDEPKASNKVGSAEQAEVTGRLSSKVCPGDFFQVQDVVSKKLPLNDKDDSSNAFERCTLSKNSKSSNARVDAEPSSLDSMKDDRLSIQAEIGPTKRGRKLNSLINSPEGYDPWMYSIGRRTPKKSHLGTSENRSSDGSPVSHKLVAKSKNGQMDEPLVFSSKINGRKRDSSPFSNAGGHPKKKGKLLNQNASPRPISVSKEASLRVQVDEKAPQSDIKRKKEQEGRKTSEIKKGKCSTKVADATEIEKETAQALGHLIMEEGTEVLSDCEEKKTPHSANESAKKNGNDGSSVQMGSKKGSLVHEIPAKDSIELSSDKKKAGPKGSEENEAPKTKSKRKHSADKSEVSGMPSLGEELVGKRILVWWPIDKTFYEGLVDSYDNFQRKHKVVYMDGDEEILNLKRQQWKLSDDNVSPNISQEKKVKSKSLRVPQVDISYSKKRKKMSSSASKATGKSGAKSADGGSKLENQVFDDEPIQDSSKVDAELETETLKTADGGSKLENQVLDDEPIQDSSKVDAELETETLKTADGGSKLENQVLDDEPIQDSSKVDAELATETLKTADGGSKLENQVLDDEPIQDSSKVDAELATETLKTDLDPTTEKVQTPSKDEFLHIGNGQDGVCRPEVDKFD